MQGQPHIHCIDDPHQPLNGHQGKHRPKHTQRHRLEQELNEDEGVLGPDGLLNADDLGPFAHRDKHDVRNAEAAHQDGEDGDEPSADSEVGEDAVEDAGQHFHSVHRKVVFPAWPNASHGPKLLNKLVFKGGEFDARLGLDCDLAVVVRLRRIHPWRKRRRDEHELVQPRAHEALPFFRQDPDDVDFHPTHLEGRTHGIVLPKQLHRHLVAHDGHRTARRAFGGREIPAVLDVQADDAVVIVGARTHHHAGHAVVARFGVEKRLGLEHARLRQSQPRHEQFEVPLGGWATLDVLPPRVISPGGPGPLGDEQHVVVEHVEGVPKFRLQRVDHRKHGTDDEDAHHHSEQAQKRAKAVDQNGLPCERQTFPKHPKPKHGTKLLRRAGIPHGAS